MPDEKSARNSDVKIVVPGWLKNASLIVSVLAVLGGGLWSVYDSRLHQQAQIAELKREITELKNQAEGRDKLLEWQVTNGFERVETKVDKIYDEFPDRMAKAIDNHEKHMHYKEWSSESSPTANASDYVIVKPNVDPTPLPKDIGQLLNGSSKKPFEPDPYPFFDK